MPAADPMPLEQMRSYKPRLTRPEDFEVFWESTVLEALRQPMNARFKPYPFKHKSVEIFEVRFDGFGGGKLAGYYARPKTAKKLPAVMIYHGYSGRGERPLGLLPYALSGMAVMSLDVRGQNGSSQDTADYPEGASLGWMTKGIRDPRTYYYRHVYADAVRAMELLGSRDEVDGSRMAVTGGSQGGALTLAVAALSDRPILALADVPFLCDFRRSVQLTPAGPFPEIANFLKNHPHLEHEVFETLSYVDCVNLAPEIKCRTVICNCLWDDICLPSTIYAAHNHIIAPKQMEVYPYHKHEVPYEHNELKLRLLLETLKP